jgi:hypothetical protein
VRGLIPGRGGAPLDGRAPRQRGLGRAPGGPQQRVAHWVDLGVPAGGWGVTVMGMGSWWPRPACAWRHIFARRAQAPLLSPASPGAHLRLGMSPRATLRAAKGGVDLIAARMASCASPPSFSMPSGIAGALLLAMCPHRCWPSPPLYSRSLQGSRTRTTARSRLLLRGHVRPFSPTNHHRLWQISTPGQSRVGGLTGRLAMPRPPAATPRQPVAGPT